MAQLLEGLSLYHTVHAILLRWARNTSPPALPPLFLKTAGNHRTALIRRKSISAATAGDVVLFPMVKARPTDVINENLSGHALGNTGERVRHRNMIMNEDFRHCSPARNQHAFTTAPTCTSTSSSGAAWAGEVSKSLLVDHAHHTNMDAYECNARE